MTKSAVPPVGNHEFRIVGDILHVKWRAEFSLPDVQHLYQLVTELHQEYQQVFQLIDGTEGRGMSPEARRWAVANTNPINRADGIACFGFNRMMRAIATLLVRAITIMSKQHAPISFFTTEAEVRAWINSLRLHAK